MTPTAEPKETKASDPLAAVRTAIEAQDWPTALEAARTAAVGGDEEVEARRLDLQAEAAWWLGRLDECIECREAAYVRFDEQQQTRAAGQAAVWLWEHHAISGRRSVAGGWLRRARRSLDGDTECQAYGNLVLREAETAHGHGALDEAVALADAALQLGRRLRCADLEAEALQTKGRILIEQGHLHDGMGHLDEAMLFAVEGRLGPFSTGKVYCSLIAACEEVDDFDRAAEWTEVTMRWAQRHPFAIFPGICRVHRAIVLKRRGALEDAEREALQACEELRASHVGNSAAAYAEVGDIRRRLGDLEAAEVAFARFQELGGGPCGGLALLRLAQGKVATALTMVTRCLDATPHPHALARAGLLPVLAQVSIAAHDLSAAADAVDELRTITDAFDTPTLRATELGARGRLELARRDPAAVATLREATAAWHALAVPYEEATARTLLGQALRDAGAEEEASASFAAAAALFEQIGVHLDASVVHEQGARVRPAGLTEREVEVLQLLAGGLTNNEIAQRLHLSAKTVSRHLSNIFTKIGVSTRAAATAFAFEHDLIDH